MLLPLCSQAAPGGLLFLDEVDALPLATQAKLLTAIEQREVRRLGSTHAEPVDVWIMSATNARLDAAVARREFRLDLYHRISAATIEVPPLRARGRDVVTLAEAFLVRLCADYALAPKRLSPPALAALLAHPWPGNVRELVNVLERAVLLADGDEITPGLMELPLPSTPVAAPPPTTRPEGGDERGSLREALEAVGWNLSRAAARVKMPRNTLRYRMERLGLHPPGGAGAARPALHARQLSPHPLLNQTKRLPETPHVVGQALPEWTAFKAEVAASPAGPRFLAGSFFDRLG